MFSSVASSRRRLNVSACDVSSSSNTTSPISVPVLRSAAVITTRADDAPMAPAMRRSVKSSSRLSAGPEEFRSMLVDAAKSAKERSTLCTPRNRSASDRRSTLVMS
jgi:hypothetical protein